jgi:hypothetical protein
MAPLKLDKLPVVGFLLKWFKTEEIVIDNDLFRLHHQELILGDWEQFNVRECLLTL